MRGAWIALSVGLVVVSCDDVNVHILTANPYDAAGQCVGVSQAVDVVAGPSNGDNCTPVCLLSSGNEQTEVYVTVVCPPYPGDYSTEAMDATTGASDPCTGAFAAYAAYEDSGVPCGTTSDEGGEDAAPDGGDDGSEPTDAGDGGPG
jgi:hypothetical protein